MPRRTKPDSTPLVIPRPPGWTPGPAIVMIQMDDGSQITPRLFLVDAARHCHQAGDHPAARLLLEKSNTIYREP